MQEIWKPIHQYDGYEVSSFGRVRSKKRGEWKLLVPNSATRYLTVNLYKNKDMKSFTIHKLVADAFLGSKPEMTEICHSDGNRFNNSADNLRYDSKAANSYDSVLMKVHAGENNGRSVLCERCVSAIKHLLEIGANGSDLARAFDVTPTTVSNIKLGKQWKQ